MTRHDVTTIRLSDIEERLKEEFETKFAEFWSQVPVLLKNVIYDYEIAHKGIKFYVYLDISAPGNRLVTVLEYQGYSFEHGDRFMNYAVLSAEECPEEVVKRDLANVIPFRGCANE